MLAQNSLSLAAAAAAATAAEERGTRIQPFSDFNNISKCTIRRAATTSYFARVYRCSSFRVFGLGCVVHGVVRMTHRYAAC
jgi:hypothetical protein